MQFILYFILTILIALLILFGYLQYEKRSTKTINKPAINNRIMDKNPLDNATYIECHDTQEENKEYMLNEILHQWRVTNFWLGCIGIVFLFILLGILISIIFSIQAGRALNDIFRTL